MDPKVTLDNNATIYDMRVDDMLDPVGLDNAAPIFSWKTASSTLGWKQTAYEILVRQGDKVVWDSGRVEKDISVGIPYEGDAPKDSTEYSWNVTLWNRKGEMTVSKEATFEMGLMGKDAFSDAKWITYEKSVFSENESHVIEEGTPKGGKGGGSAEKRIIRNEEEGLPAYRKAITLKNGLVSAKLYTTALGVYETYINGARVGRLHTDGSMEYHELKPGYTQPWKRVFYSTYDVTRMLEEGKENVISAVVTSGWWTGDAAANRGDRTAYLCKLILTYEDGRKETVVTDGTWRTAKASAIRMGDIFHGEIYDARADLSYMKAGFDDTAWNAVTVYTAYQGEISAWSGSYITVREDLERSAQSLSVYEGVTGASVGYYGRVKTVATYKDGDKISLKPEETLLVDFGQNFAGWEAFTVEGAAGTRITVAHGEMLNDNNGAIVRGNDGPEGSIYNANYRSARSLTQYILKGDGVESYHPAFTYHGFRYVEITADNAVTVHRVSAQVVTSVEKESGFMETSDADVNQLISNIRWGMYSNYLSVPTDCPQRDERQGWAADTQVFAKTGCFFGFSKSFLMKFVEDMRDAQHDDGNYPTTAPRTRFDEPGTLGWADAGVIVPYYLYLMYGDASVITEHWKSMERFMAFLATTDGWGGSTLHGDWLAYESNDEQLKRILGVSYYAWVARLMSEMATVIGKAAEAAKYLAVYEAEKAFYQQFVRNDGTLIRGEQSVCLYALHLDLLPDKASVEAVTKQLTDNIARNGNRLQTGFLGTAILLPTLTAIGRSDLAYTLLLQHDNPSWLYSVDQGATTVWERWNSYTTESGFGDVGMNSFNHYAYGTVGGWLFEAIAGINADIASPGFKRVILAPQPDSRLAAKASYDSAYGLITACSRFEQALWIYSCSLPANTSGEVRIPAASMERCRVNNKALPELTLEQDGVCFVAMNDGVLLFEAVAGSFTFTVQTA